MSCSAGTHVYDAGGWWDGKKCECGKTEMVERDGMFVIELPPSTAVYIPYEADADWQCRQRLMCVYC